MATMKKQRQRLTMKIKRTLGLDIAVARKVARHILDMKGYSGDIRAELTHALGEPAFFPGCECCGNSSNTWKGKNGTIREQYCSFKLEEKNV